MPPEGLRHMDFVTEFADEADSQHACRDTSNLALTYTQIGKRILVKISCRESSQHFFRFRAREVYDAIGTRDIRNIDIKLPLYVPFKHLPVDILDTSGCSRHVKMSFRQPGSNTIVNNDTRFIAHECIL